jgi:hypothetical protein
MTEIAVEYILDILTKKAMLPTAFIEESFDWIHQWLLEPNPKIAIRLFDSNRSLDNKRGIIETQLDTLENNVLFQRALATKLLLFVQYKVKNTGNTLGESNNEKNIAKNSAVQAGRDARFGDDVVNGNQTVNHYHGLDKTKLDEQFVSREEMDERDRVASEWLKTMNQILKSANETADKKNQEIDSFWSKLKEKHQYEKKTWDF